ncbi:Mannose-6-phosphate isomerase [Chitinispirillum alkaliphilum]|nr:Mannose-6-phosphate isomerase [Chitinispirillum alkaliphilum]
MMKNKISEPLLFEPVLKEKVWGGDALGRKLNKPLPPKKAIGESWEICGIDNECSVIRSGSFAGASLNSLYSLDSKSLVGSLSNNSSFPLLVKFIDARDNLSVQVHPGDVQSRQKNWSIRGKTECWYVVEAQENTKIIAGFNRNVSKEEVIQAIENQSLHELLNFLPVKNGDVLFIPAGTVHAIMNGTFVYEVQESSDTTLRLYDWGRTDSEGKSRKLHIKEALDVITTKYQHNLIINPVTLEIEDGVKHLYRAVCRYFALEQFVFSKDTSISLEPKQSFRIISSIEQDAELIYDDGSITIKKGQTVLLPASLKHVKLEAPKNANLLLSSVPDIKKEITDPLINYGISSESIALLGGDKDHNDLLQYL